MDQLIEFASGQALLSGVWIGLVVLIIVATIKIKMSPIKQISPQELTILVNRENGVVVDTRTDKDFKTSRIIDAQHLNSEKVNKNDFTSLEKNKDKPIIVVCTAGISAVKVANQLFKAGFTNVSVLKGGMNAWLGAGLPVVKK